MCNVFRHILSCHLFMATTVVMLLLLPEELGTVERIYLLGILYLCVVYVIAHNEHFVIQKCGEILPEFTCVYGHIQLLA